MGLSCILGICRIVKDMRISDEQFEDYLRDAVASIPSRFASRLDNVAFVVADEPTPEQEASGGMLHGHGILLGLYEGIPLPQRAGGYGMVVPDVITVFKTAHELVYHDAASMAHGIHQTVWHEVAHYFGLGHGQIHSLER